MGFLNYLEEVEPAHPASGGVLASSAVYRAKDAKRCGRFSLPFTAALSPLRTSGWPVLPGVSTLFEAFSKSRITHAARPCLGTRGRTAAGKAGPYEWQTYAQVGVKVDKLAAYLAAVGVERKSTVGIYGNNSADWMVAMQACIARSIVIVPLYESLGHDAVSYQLDHAECGAVLVEAAKLPKLADALKLAHEAGKKRFVKHIIFWGPVGADAKLQAASKDIRDMGASAVSLEEALMKGNTPAPPAPPQPSDLFCIMYTSGSTGTPKGVLLTHANLVAVMAGVDRWMAANSFQYNETEVMISYLPLAHIFEQVIEHYQIMRGAATGYWQADPKALLEDIQALKPTLFCGVPRIFDRIYAAIKAKVGAKFLSRLLFGFFYDRKLAALNRGVSYKRAGVFGDALVFKKIKAQLGGRVRLVVSGAAPLAKHTEDFLRVTMCCPVIQGYGLTETCASSFMAVPDNVSYNGTVGLACPSIEFKLEAVPDMKYDPLATPPRGEVCMRGPGVFTGYYKMPELSAEAIDKDGWFHSGDIGEVVGDALKIIDRKKNIFKLSQGEYVAVEKVENVLGACSCADQVWVYGNCFESFLVAVVVPNEVAIRTWASKNGIAAAPGPEGYETLTKNPKAAAWMVEQLEATGRSAKLMGFEIVKAVLLEHRPFDIERGLMTPTFKRVRGELFKYYKAQIEDMYESAKAAGVGNARDNKYGCIKPVDGSSKK